jgi:hypothetical protein
MARQPQGHVIDALDDRRAPHGGLAVDDQAETGVEDLDAFSLAGVPGIERIGEIDTGLERHLFAIDDLAAQDIALPVQTPPRQDPSDLVDGSPTRTTWFVAIEGFNAAGMIPVLVDSLALAGVRAVCS